MLLVYALRRLVWSVGVVVAVAAVAFAGIRILRPELNRGVPLHEGLADYLVGVFLHFDFGPSWGAPAGDRPVADLVREGFGADLSLMAGGLVVGVLAGVAGGAVCAARPGSLAARALEVVASVALVAPVYVVALIALLLFAPGFGKVELPFFFEPHAYEPLSVSPWDWLRSLVLPWVILGAPLAAVCLRMTRASMVDTLHEDFMRTATAKGLSSRRAIRRHAVPAAAAPVASVAGVSVPVLVTNVVLIERAFSVPGLFHLTPDAVADGNFPVLQAMAIVAAVLIVVATLVVDLVLAWLDPRIRQGVPA